MNMRFEFSNINTQYNNTNADAIAAIMKENASAANSNIASVYEASDMDIDAAVLSISDKGISRIKAMLSKSILLSTQAASTTLSPQARQNVTNEINSIRIEIDDIREEEADEVIADKAKNIINHASESIMTQNSNRESVLQLL